MRLELKANAKINWTLEVLGVRADGYHEIRSVILPVQLHDDVVLSPAADVVCEMDMPGVGQAENLAYRAAIALKDATGCANGARIEITKRIPSGAGLGGGSSDAAAVLNGLNELWNLGLPRQKLCEIAARVGSDVPALVFGGAVLAEGRGEMVRRLPPEMAVACNVPRNMDDVVLHVPEIAVSTAAVYREFRPEDRGLGANDLQPAAIRIHPAIALAIERLKSRGVQRVTMSGSGSALYGLRRRCNPPDLA